MKKEMTGLRIQEVEELVMRWEGVRQKIVAWQQEGFTNGHIRKKLIELGCTDELGMRLLRNLPKL